MVRPKSIGEGWGHCCNEINDQEIRPAMGSWASVLNSEARSEFVTGKGESRSVLRILMLMYVLLLGM